MDVLFVRSYVPDFDGKFEKYKHALELAKLSWGYLGWNRTENSSFVSRYGAKVRLFNKKSKLAGGAKTSVNILLWNIYLFCSLVKSYRQVKVVHVIDLDSALPVYLFCRLFGKK